jgi:hypothetical protein
MLGAGFLAGARARALVFAILLVSLALDTHDLFASSFTSRDASLQVRALTTPDDYVVGDGAHVLSLNAPYRAVQAYPGRGVNREFVARTKPRFLFREVDHRDVRINDPIWTEFSIKESDFFAIGATKVEPIAEFPLYPVRRMPAEVTYRLYQVSY